MAKLPKSFKKILWSYDFSKCDPVKMKNVIISQGISYGTLKDWRWLADFYGKDELKRFLHDSPEGNFRPSVKKLADLIF